jgi:hypothetical protein
MENLGTATGHRVQSRVNEFAQDGVVVFVFKLAEEVNFNGRKRL